MGVKKGLGCNAEPDYVRRIGLRKGTEKSRLGKSGVHRGTG